MDFIRESYHSGKGDLFHTTENPDKERVTFAEFMRYLSMMSTFTNT